MVTTNLSRPENIRALVDVKNGLVDRRIFHDADIYQLELEKIFARAWLFMCHESQIPNPGDFFMSFMGEDRVIIVRDNDGSVQVLVNSCRHRGNAVCRAEEGHATSFMCTYHGWTYDLKGNLVGVPGFKEVYHEELDRANWGLIKAAQVDSYKGLVFATMDAAAPTLHDWLSEVGRYALDSILKDGTTEAFPGLTKFNLPANWKFAQDNSNDHYHGQVTHASARLVPGYMAKTPEQTRALFKYANMGNTFLSEYGHTLSAVLIEGLQDMEGVLGSSMRSETQIGHKKVPATGTMCIFPNVFIGGGNIELRHPRGPHQTEIWMWSIVDKNAAPEIRTKTRMALGHVFGPAGMHEQDDGENWGESTKAAGGVITSKYPLHYRMRLGTGQIIEDEDSPPRIESMVNEHGQLWIYRAWAEMMAAPDWDDYKQSHSLPKGTV